MENLFINYKCISCDSCRVECPTNAIKEGDPIYYINTSFCIKCSGYFEIPRCIQVCPVDAIEELKNKILKQQTKAKYGKNYNCN